MEGQQYMTLRCSWCMKKLGDNVPLFGLNVKFREVVDFKDREGSMTSIYLATRNTSVPFIVVAAGSEAKQKGIDGIFTVCSEKCGLRMKESLENEIELFSDSYLGHLK